MERCVELRSSGESLAARLALAVREIDVDARAALVDPPAAAVSSLGADSALVAVEESEDGSIRRLAGLSGSLERVVVAVGVGYMVELSDREALDALGRREEVMRLRMESEEETVAKLRVDYETATSALSRLGDLAEESSE
jgi:hypothetical protein